MVAISTAHLRIARPTNSIESLLSFYRDGLGFEVLFTFENHADFDGAMLGRKGMPYHLEFTQHKTHDAGRAPTEDNLLVFYLPDESEYEEAIEKMEKAGFGAVKSFNPYWDQHGKTFEDPDGYRIVFANMKSEI